jgi:protein-S-isoprenylcysteine O-methyltransferase Ste14
MAAYKLMDRLLAVKPNILMSLGLALTIAVGLGGEFLGWGRLPGTPFSNIVGGVVLFCGWLLHVYCHQFHHQAHQQTAQIQALITVGPFARVRHPMYLSLILLDGGMSLAWGIGWMLAPFVFFVGLAILIMIQEEKTLLQTIGPEYREYMNRVPWRLIPGIF